MRSLQPRGNSNPANSGAAQDCQAQWTQYNDWISEHPGDDVDKPECEMNADGSETDD